MKLILNTSKVTNFLLFDYLEIKMFFSFLELIITKWKIIVMNSDLETFNYFVDDLLSLDPNLLKCVLDLLMIQDLFNSVDLQLFVDMDIQEDIIFLS